jgi:hypothetical protein
MPMVWENTIIASNISERRLRLKGIAQAAVKKRKKKKWKTRNRLKKCEEEDDKDDDDEEEWFDYFFVFKKISSFPSSRYVVRP